MYNGFSTPWNIVVHIAWILHMLLDFVLDHVTWFKTLIILNVIFIHHAFLDHAMKIFLVLRLKPFNSTVSGCDGCNRTSQQSCVHLTGALALWATAVTLKMKIYQVARVMRTKFMAGIMGSCLCSELCDQVVLCSSDHVNKTVLDYVFRIRPAVQEYFLLIKMFQRQ
jgi:hypothetical protein